MAHPAHRIRPFGVDLFTGVVSPKFLAWRQALSHFMSFRSVFLKAWGFGRKESQAQQDTCCSAAAQNHLVRHETMMGFQSTHVQDAQTDLP